MNCNKKRKYKRKSKPSKTDESKRKKEIQEKTIPAASCSNVKMLKDAKGTLENRSFSEFNYELMATLFKGNDMNEVVRILNDSPASISEFDKPLPLTDISQNKKQCSSTLPVVNSCMHESYKASSLATPSKPSSTQNISRVIPSKENQPETIKNSVKYADDSINHTTEDKTILCDSQPSQNITANVTIQDITNSPKNTPSSSALSLKIVNQVETSIVLASNNLLIGDGLITETSTTSQLKENNISSSTLIACPTEAETNNVNFVPICDPNGLTSFLPQEDSVSFKTLKNISPVKDAMLSGQESSSQFSTSNISENLILARDQRTLVFENRTENRSSYHLPTIASPSESVECNISSLETSIFDHVQPLYLNTPKKDKGHENHQVNAVSNEIGSKENENSPSIIRNTEPVLTNNSATDSDLTNCEDSFECVPSTSYTVTNNNAQDIANSYVNEMSHVAKSDSEVDDSDRDPNYENDIDGDKSSVSSDDESSSKQSENEIVPRTRKRKADPTRWKRNIAKTLRNSGQQYITLKRGNLVSSREMGPPCNTTCRLKCSEKFLEHERKRYFDRYWALKDINKQRNFISKSLQVIKPKYRYPKQHKSRKLNHAFYLHEEGGKVRVCKHFFVSTLGITNRCIRTVIDKTKDGFLSDDQRGKHDKHVTVPESVKNEARNHIASIPTVESHYTRADTTKNYIEGGRSLMDIYRDYKHDCQREHRDFVSFAIFRQIFNYEFNLEFFKPKKDLCQFCETYKNRNQEERLDMEIEYLQHHEEKNLSRAEKEEDKKLISSKYRVACFDLQAALPTPKGEVSTFYYKSKLSTYNFTICELNNKGLGTVNCYLWHEGEGHKGSNEIGSSLLHYLELCAATSNEEVSSEDSSYPDIVFYSDNCGGQGKNKFIIAAYLYAIAKLNIKSITHKFLVVGHTQNEGDVSHSLIEKNIRKALKSSPIYLPSQYATLISTARKYGNPFVVHELEHTFFYDLKNLVESTASNFNINDDGERFNFNDICVIKVEKEHPGTYFYKTSYKDEEYKTVNVTLSRTRRQLKQFQDVQLQKAYTDSIPISQRKYRDLMSLVASDTIPRCHSTFYENLKHD